MTDYDRTVHAVDKQTGVELVRYERAGKWYLEYEPGLLLPWKRVSVTEAAQWAVDNETVVYDRLGGRRFFSEYRKRLAAAGGEL